MVIGYRLLDCLERFLCRLQEVGSISRNPDGRNMGGRDERLYSAYGRQGLCGIKRGCVIGGLIS